MIGPDKEVNMYKILIVALSLILVEPYTSQANENKAGYFNYEKSRDELVYKYKDGVDYEVIISFFHHTLIVHNKNMWSDIKEFEKSNGKFILRYLKTTVTKGFE